MAGLYIHIPFCKQACHYCNFHFSISLKQKEALMQAIHQELELRKSDLDSNALESVYLGGGTPSILTGKELDQLFESISKHYKVLPDAEITIEANPDDLSPEKIKAIKNTPINRFSIGVQSFQEKDLRWMNRAHRADESIQCLEEVQKAGFHNITIDLIYGSPTTHLVDWQNNLDIAFGFEIPHLSCYCLTVEPQTALDYMVRKGKSKPVDEQAGITQFEILMKIAPQKGYDHYEISNFAKPGYHAIHNSNYWKGKPYLGIGPSAHSFDGHTRSWNIANNSKYIKAIKQQEKWFETETITPSMQFNEYVMTRLRTKWGCQLSDIPSSFQQHFLSNITPFVEQGTVKKIGQIYKLTNEGKLITDHISMSLFYVD